MSGWGKTKSKKPSKELCDWSEINEGCGVWIVRRTIVGGIGLSVCNKTGRDVDVEIEFGVSRNTCVDTKGGGTHIKEMLEPHSSKDLAVFMALDPQDPISCTYKATCNIIPGIPQVLKQMPQEASSDADSLQQMFGRYPSLQSPGAAQSPPSSAHSPRQESPKRQKSVSSVNAWLETTPQRKASPAAASPPSRQKTSRKKASPPPAPALSKKKVSLAPSVELDEDSSAVEEGTPWVSVQKALPGQQFSPPPLPPTPEVEERSLRRESSSVVPPTPPKFPSDPKIPPPRPPDKTELLRTPVEPSGSGAKVFCVVEKLGESAIGFEIHNKSTEDGQVTIDFSNSKNNKIIALGDLFEGEAVTGSILRGGVRSLAVCMRKRQGLWDYCHSLSWVPYTGRNQVQHHELARGITLKKYPQKDSTWDFAVKNDITEDIVITLNFEGSCNLGVLPLGASVFSDVKNNGYHMSVSTAAGCGGVETRVCNVGPRNSSKGWSWSYKVSHYIDRKEGRDDKRSLPLATTTTRLSEGVELSLIAFEGNQVHTMIYNRRSMPVEVMVVFYENDQITHLPCKGVVKDDEESFSMCVAPYAKMPFTVAVQAGKHASDPEVFEAQVRETGPSQLFNQSTYSMTGTGSQFPVITFSDSF